MSTLPGRVLVGAAYYHEYMPYERLKADLDLMAAAGFSVIRVGESVWSTWEPEEGAFDVEWLAPVVDEAHARGISVVLGTPTYAVPPWLHRKYPETTAQRRTGQPIPYGHRQDVDITHPAFRFLAERVVRRIVARYADHPGVIGYQVDNEPGNELLHNPAVFAGFVDELRAKYGDVETLNDAWGLTYWSHRISRWSELWTPDGNTVPSYDLAWRRYQARLTSEFVAWQAGIVRELARANQFVTTCLALDRVAVDAVQLAASLDVTATNLYYPMQDALTMPRPPEIRIGGQPEWLKAAGPWLPFFQADVSRGVRQEPFLVTETDAATIGESYANYPAYDGQWRLVAWALVARGARMIEYWHWHTLHYGNETYWGGVLGHDLLPGRCYDEIARIGAELSAAGEAVIDLVPDAEAAVLISPESRWAWQFQPPLAVEGGTAGDRRSYDRVLHAFYRGLFAAGLQVDVVAPSQLGGSAADLVARWPVLVAPALYIADDELLRQLRDYARQGGHLVLGFHSGYADEEARPRPEAMPAVL
ncbi:MAG: beta-galactosidase, partial [Acidimicrobiaceae bacterium]|nr:beta-galactosidase [Acidimicrobiaceae bacterium]